MKNIVAFFDIDGTLYREGLISELFKKLIKHEIIANEKWYKDVKPYYQKWDKRMGNYDDYLIRMADIYIDAVKGLHKTQIEYIAKQIISQKGDKVYTYTRDRIKWHKEQGHILIIISGSPIELVSEMSKKHGFDDFKGTTYVMDENNIYTGEIIPMWDSISKKKSIDEFAKKYEIDLSKSYAYGDTAGDLSMLSSVGNPTCINPTRELLECIISNEILKQKTNVIVERKDFIYKLTPEAIEEYI